MSSLRVAVLAPISWRVPPRHYGPWEQFASLLTEGLVAKGVDVTLFATADSVTTGRLASVVERGYSEDPSIEPKVAECLHIAHVFERAAEFDLIHNSFDFLPLSYSGLVDTPVLTTIHGFSSERILPVYQRYNATHRLRRDQRRRPAPDPRLRRHDPSRHRHGRRSGCTRPPAATCSSSGGSTRTREPSRRSTSPLECRAAARDRRDRPGSAVLRRARRSPDRRGRGCRLSAR